MVFFPPLPHLKFGSFLREGKLSSLFRSLKGRTLVIYGDFVEQSGILEILNQFPTSIQKRLCLVRRPERVDLSLVQNMQNEYGRFEQVFGIGGGGTLDFAKLLCVKAQSNKEWYEIFYGLGYGCKKANIQSDFYCIPTHYSSGSYASKSALLEYQGRKLSVFSQGLRAREVYVDVSCMKTLSRERILKDSVDTLAHFLEIYLAFAQEEGILKTSLTGWLNDFTVAMDQNDYKALFFLSGFLLGGFYPLERVFWPMHSLSHELEVCKQISHVDSLALLFPLFLDHYEKDLPDQCMQRLRKLQEIMGLELTEIQGISRAVSRTVAHQGKLFRYGQNVELYKKILSIE